jgi:hypothetical protein
MSSLVYGGGSVKREAEATCGTVWGTGAACGTDEDIRAACSMGGGTGATRGAASGFEVPVIEEGRVEQSVKLQDWTRRGSPSHQDVCWRRQRGRMTRQRRRAGRPTGGSWGDQDTGTPCAQRSTQERHTDRSEGRAYGEQWQMCLGSRRTRRPVGGRRREWC